MIYPTLIVIKLFLSRLESRTGFGCWLCFWETSTSLSFPANALLLLRARSFLVMTNCHGARRASFSSFPSQLCRKKKFSFSAAFQVVSFSLKCFSFSFQWRNFQFYRLQAAQDGPVEKFHIFLSLLTISKLLADIRHKAQQQNPKNPSFMWAEISLMHF